VVKVPFQKLLLFARHEKLCQVRNLEEGKLPVLIEIPIGCRVGALFISESWEWIFGDSKSLDQAWVLDGEGRGHADAFVVRKNVCGRDVQEIQNALEVSS